MTFFLRRPACRLKWSASQNPDDVLLVSSASGRSTVDLDVVIVLFACSSDWVSRVCYIHNLICKTFTDSRYLFCDARDEPCWLTETWKSCTPTPIKWHHCICLGFFQFFSFKSITQWKTKHNTHTHILKYHMFFFMFSSLGFIYLDDLFASYYKYIYSIYECEVCLVLYCFTWLINVAV